MSQEKNTLSPQLQAAVSQFNAQRTKEETSNLADIAANDGNRVAITVLQARQALYNGNLGKMLSDIPKIEGELVEFKVEKAANAVENAVSGVAHKAENMWESMVASVNNHVASGLKSVAGGLTTAANDMEVVNANPQQNGSVTPLSTPKIANIGKQGGLSV